ncbi:MAG: DUF1569 domain-containing protein [Planctomycetes bacterium]|nr:DUF1569 domain-containing protein [Planctomycetota bacterium]
MIDTAKVIEHRKLHFASIDECIAEVDRIVAADQAGTLRRLGNWTAGQNLAHLASWIEYAYVGFPLKRPPFFVRWVLKFMVGKYARDGMPKGVKIPGTERGTFGMDDIPTAEAAERYKKALARLKNGEPSRYHSPGFGQVSESVRLQLMLRHAELHLGFLVP